MPPVFAGRAGDNLHTRVCARDTSLQALVCSGQPAQLVVKKVPWYIPTCGTLPHLLFISRSMSVVKQRLQTLKHGVHTYIMPLVIVHVQHIYGTDEPALHCTQNVIKSKSVNEGDRNLIQSV